MALEAVLVVDDEPDDIAALLAYFKQCNIPHDYASSLSDGFALVREKAEQGTAYGLVISDNHFCDGDYLDEVPSFDGVDFANILVGNKKNLTPGHLAVAREEFGSHYPAIMESYRGNVVVFSGSAPIDAQSNPELFEGFDIAQKTPDRGKHCCEYDIISIMKERGYHFSESPAWIRAYKKSNSLSDGGVSAGQKRLQAKKGVRQGCVYNARNPVDRAEADHERAVREFLAASGMVGRELEELCPADERGYLAQDSYAA